MRVVHSTTGLQNASGGVLVPTMGALHRGHLALVARARPLAGPLVVSVFVNPTQFGPGDDWQRYPRTLDADLAAAERAGADIVFAPDADAMYPPGESIPVPALPSVATTPGLEDAHRPGHFAGVCQVVARLFDVVRPAAAVFGEKDYQQLRVITEMVRAEGDRWPGLEIIGHPTVREDDGLAMSSRNARLPAGRRDQALGLYRALQSARLGEQHMRTVLENHGLDVDYAVVRDSQTLLHPAGTRPARALVAARLGDVRLIDNIELE
jgi:pantoate--beta-alanine ligase